MDLVTSPEEVRQRAAGWLAAHPYTANIPASVLADLPADGGGVCWGVCDDGSGVVAGVAMESPGRPAYVPDIGEQAATAVADALWSAGRRPRGVLGDTAASGAYARRWAELSGRPLTPRRRETLYVLGRLRPPAGAPGSARPAVAADLDLVEAWFSAFVVEVYPTAPDPVARPELEARVAAGRILLWTDAGGSAVAMCGYRPPAAGVGRVGPVYTPPAHRGHGYAGAVTAAATRSVLDLGGEAMLFTDASNTVSNHVYRTIGYRPRGEITRWEP